MIPCNISLNTLSVSVVLNKLTKTHFVAESSCATTAVQRAWPPPAARGMAIIKNL